MDSEWTADSYARQLNSNLHLVYGIVTKNRDCHMDKAKLRHDRTKRPSSFQVGDQVLLLDQTTKKGKNKSLGPKWFGPFVVVESISESTYKIKSLRQYKRRKLISVVNIEKHRRYFVQPSQSPADALDQTVAAPSQDIINPDKSQRLVVRRQPRHQPGRSQKQTLTSSDVTESASPASPVTGQQLPSPVHRSPNFSLEVNPAQTSHFLSPSTRTSSKASEHAVLPPTPSDQDTPETRDSPHYQPSYYPKRKLAFAPTLPRRSARIASARSANLS